MGVGDVWGENVDFKQCGIVFLYTNFFKDLIVRFFLKISQIFLLQTIFYFTCANFW
jgi:hypothetical protein